jgi:superfamily II helicase
MKNFKNGDVIDDIICDICQNSCVSENCYDGNPEYNYLTINGSFGYFSKNKDCESWDAHICENCVDNFLEKIVCFNKTDYLDNSGIGRMNERADRIRKIRKLTGELEFKIISNDD